MKRTGTLPVKKEGIDRRYLSVKDKAIPQFERNKDKIEGGVKLEEEGTLLFKQDRLKVQQVSQYESKINSKVQTYNAEAANETGAFGNNGQEMPKFGFDSLEVY